MSAIGNYHTTHEQVAREANEAHPQLSIKKPGGDLQDLERKAILEALQRAHGHKSRAAALLGLTRFQLYARLKRLHIDVSPD